MESQNLRGAEPEYTMQGVVDRTGVPGDTIRSWERRYGVPVPVRDASSQRLYSENDIRTISWMRDQRDAGRSLSEIVDEVRTSGPGELATTSTARARPQFEIVSATSAARSQHSEEIDALLGFDPGPISTLVGEVVATRGGPNAAFTMLLPLADEIQTRFEEGECRNIAREYAYSWIRRRLLTLLTVNEIEASVDLVLAIVARTATDDLHVICHAIDLARDGYNVITLEHPPAVSELLRLMIQLSPRALIICADTESSAWEAMQVGHLVEEQSTAALSRVAIGYCGRGFRDGPYLRGVPGTCVLPDQRRAYRVLLRNT